MHNSGRLYCNALAAAGAPGALRAGVKPSQIDGIASEALMKQVTRDADYKRWIGEFLT